MLKCEKENSENFHIDQYKQYWNENPKLGKIAMQIVYDEIVLKEYVKESIIQQTGCICSNHHPIEEMFMSQKLPVIQSYGRLENILREKIKHVREDSSIQINPKSHYISSIQLKEGTLHLPSNIFLKTIYSSKEEYMNHLSDDEKELLVIYGIYSLSQCPDKKLSKLLAIYLANVNKMYDIEVNGQYFKAPSNYHSLETLLLKEIACILNLKNLNGNYVLASILYNGDTAHTLSTFLEFTKYTTFKNKIRYLLMGQSIGNVIVKSMETMEKMSLQNQMETLEELELLFADIDQIQKSKKIYTQTDQEAIKTLMFCQRKQQ